MVPILSITGTKGKTTTVRLLDEVVRAMGTDVMRVDTDGHYRNGKQKSDYAFSMDNWGIVPNVCPGRYLYEAATMDQQNTVALLEAAIGSSQLWGLGYVRHNVGIFTNVYSDHITAERIKSRADIYKAKRFIHTQLTDDGTFIWNSDDAFLSNHLRKETIPQTKIAVGRTLGKLQKSSFLKKNLWVQIDGTRIVLHKGAKKTVLVDCASVPLTFNGVFEPNLYNVGFVFAGAIALFGVERVLKNLVKIQACMEAYQPSKEGGRLVVVPAPKKNATLIIDFAHERESMKRIAELGRTFGKGRVVGVLRMDPRRTDVDIVGTGKAIAPYYDAMYIYDKVDGVHRSQSRAKIGGKFRGVGESMKLLAKGVRSARKHGDVHEALYEERALHDAYSSLTEGDVLIYIGAGEDHAETYKTVTQLVRKK